MASCKKVALDTSCIIPLVSAWHDHHERTVRAVHLIPDSHLIVCSHVMLESFSVLTRLPSPYRLGPREAEQMLEENFGEALPATDLGRKQVWGAIRSVAQFHIGGGKVYDAIVAYSSFRAGAARLLTWNVRDFVRFSPAELEIREP